MYERIWLKFLEEVKFARIYIWLNFCGKRCCYPAGKNNAKKWHSVDDGLHFSSITKIIILRERGDVTIYGGHDLQIFR